jgi:hypothetical protein
MEQAHGSLSAGEEARLREVGPSHRGEGARYGQFVTLASGMGTLPERLAERIEAAGAARLRAVGRPRGRVGRRRMVGTWGRWSGHGAP